MDLKKIKDFPSGESFIIFGIEKWTSTPYSVQVAGSLLYILLGVHRIEGPEMIYHGKEGKLRRMAMASLKTSVIRARSRRQDLIHIIYVVKSMGGQPCT